MDANLTQLVERLARMVGHPVPDSAAPDAVPENGVYSRNQFEDYLQLARYDAAGYLLGFDRDPTQAQGQRVYRTRIGSWAAGIVLRNSSGQAVTPDTLDLVNGVFTFNAPQNAPLYVYGSSFDLHLAAAALLADWAATVKLEMDINISGLGLQRKQKYDNLRQLAEDHRKRMRAASVVVDT